MTFKQIEKAARTFVASGSISKKMKIVRGVYLAAGHAGLRLMADVISKVTGKKIRCNDIKRIGQISRYKKKKRRRHSKLDTSTISLDSSMLDSLNPGSGGKRGRGGGRKNIQDQQIWQSIR